MTKGFKGSTLLPVLYCPRTKSDSLSTKYLWYCWKFIWLSPMGMSSVKQGIADAWTLKKFAQNLLIISGRGSIDSQLIEIEICKWGGRGGQGSINSQLREDPQRVLIPGGVNWQPTDRGSTANWVMICSLLREHLQRVLILRVGSMDSPVRELRED